ncbi:MAG: tyrosine-protein phosphatase [Lachnospiraceae bacterium]|nr:tyrosine-protein phosphatase [Lachnospiraceae bacterium]
MPKLLKFDKLNNIRDIGGMKTSDGKVIASGKLIRCGNLSELSEADEEKLIKLVGTIIDFRTDGEREEHPDIVPSGVEYHHIPIMDSLTEGITREAKADQNIFERLLLKPAEAKAYMCDMYRLFVESDAALVRYGQFVKLIMDKAETQDKAVLWHCTAGKDRAGIGAAIMEELLGVPREDIIADYLKTNEYLKDNILFLTEFVKKRANTESALADESAMYLFGAGKEYIEAFYEAMEKRFGGFGEFIENGLKISTEERERLRTLLLV